MKKNIGKTPYLYPIPIVLVGSKVDGKYNFTNVGDIAIMGLKPALITISLNEKHHSTKGIIQTGKFSVNIPTSDMVKEVDYCGIYSGRDKDKSKLFTLDENEFEVPMIKQCPVCTVCKVIKDFNIEHRHIFIGEVLATYIDEDFILSDGESTHIADLDKLNPLMYTLDNKYYSLNGKVGVGYKEGRDIEL